MSTHDSRPSDGRSKHDATQNAASGSPVPEEVDELQDTQSRLTLKGDAYEAFGNDGDHKSPNVRSNGPTPAGGGTAANTSEDAYGRDSQPERQPGYERQAVLPDERIHELVCQRLTDNNHLMDISKVSIEVSKGCVSLKGTVPDQRTKAAIEDAVGTCPHVQGMSNHLEVDQAGS